MIAAAAIRLLAAAPAQASPAGFYQTQQMEVGGALELQPGGHFRYQLDYGAVSEGAEGDWTFDGKTVRLTTVPRPKAPTFKVVADKPAPKGELEVRLEPPGFGGMGNNVRVLVKMKGYPDVYDLDLDADGRAQFASGIPEVIIPKVPVYGLLGEAIPLSSERGHRLLLRFQPNDLGKADFDGETLQLNDGDLLLARYATMIRFVRVRP